MATGASFNMTDPVEQEKIRRRPHEYIATAGKHGTYVEKPYKHQEYPKMLGKWPKPEYKDFTTVNGVSIPSDMALKNWQEAVTDWDRRMSASVVHSKAEETQWLKENG